MTRIAIQNNEWSFAPRWVEYCQKNNIDYKLVDVYASDIVEQVKGCDAFMWHHNHGDYRDVLFAKPLIYSLETAGVKCFPDFHTTWHFDDKVGQKYLLEAVGAPLVPSYVFYTKKEAMEWISKTSFPKVFKLRGGAGSSNVKLAKTKCKAKGLVRRAFGCGFPPTDYGHLFFDAIKKFFKGRVKFREVAKYGYLMLRYFFKGIFMPRQKGYAYFQDFIPNNTFDIRICVVGDKAFALKRLCREHDFRASGGGQIVYDKAQIDERCVKIAFDVNEKLHAQSIAYDFVFDEQNNPLIVEISYGYSVAAYDKCEGYWDKEMNWHPGQNFDFCGWMVENVIVDCNERNK